LNVTASNKRNLSLALLIICAVPFITPALILIFFCCFLGVFTIYLHTIWLYIGWLVGAASFCFGSSSYVVLQNSPKNSLVRVSASGASVETIAEGCGGIGLAIDRSNGDYIIASNSALLHATNRGVISTVANAPTGSVWAAVIVDRKGDFIIADRDEHVLWRVATDGASAVKFAVYPGHLPPGSSDVGLTMSDSGDYLVMRLGDDNIAHLSRISPAGNTSEILLSEKIASPGARFRPNSDQDTAISGGAIMSDHLGGFVFRALLRNVNG